MQYISGRGLTEVDDVINNTARALVGYMFFVGALWLYKRTQGNKYY